jgi:hypothetical protein
MKNVNGRLIKNKGVDDAIVSGAKIKTLEGDEAMAYAEECLKSSGARPGKSKPAILESKNIKKMADEAIKALAGAANVYQRSGSLVHIVKDSKQLAQGIQRPNAPRIELLPLPSLTEKLSDRIDWQKVTDKGLVPTFPNDKAVAAIHARGVWPLAVRKLTMVVEYPLLRPDGTVIEEPGYDRDTGIYLAPALGGLPTLTEKPTHKEALAAVKSLLEVVEDFPFADPVHRAGWLAALLTPLARFAFRGPTPFFLAEANRRGAGKGLLCDCIGHILTGNGMTRTTYTANDDELRKHILAILVAGERLVFLDNLTGRVGSGAMDSLLTSSPDSGFSGRQLGHTRILKHPNSAIWFGTGNNVNLGEDTIRRTCPIRLETPLEQPERREDFRKKALLLWVKKNRRRLLGCALTILRAYYVAGRPDQHLPAWGSFEEWSDIVRGALVWAGQPDPGDARQQLAADRDERGEQIATLLRCWRRLDPKAKGMTVHTLMAKIIDIEGRFLTQDWEKTMRDTLQTLCDDDPKKVGHLLRDIKRTNYGGLFVDVVSNKHNTRLWGVRPIDKFNREAE